MTREQLTATVRKLMRDSDVCCCWSDIAEHLVIPIAALAKEMGKSTAYVLACIIDDIEDLVEEAEEAKSIKAESTKPIPITITLGFDDHDSYYELGAEHTQALAALPLDEMCSFVVDNGKSIAIESDETDLYICSTVSFTDEVEEEEIRQILRTWKN